MLKQEHLRYGYSAGKGTPGTRAGQTGCVTAGCQTGLMSKNYKMHSEY